MDTKETVVLIPAYEPDARLENYVRTLLSQQNTRVVVVDDGSGAAYAAHFAAAQALPGCTVLHHAENRGKGAALKTGCAYVARELPQCACVVTADCDGQHAPADVAALAAQARQRPEALALGTRDFGAAQVPLKSHLGNRITSAVFLALYGRWLPDTQTGLRAFGAQLLPFMAAVTGERFEYETQVLIACVRQKVPLDIVPIATLYENGNAGTHFHAFRDSARIYGVLLGSFFKFISTSLAGTALDLTLAFLLLDVLRAPLAGHDFARIALATGLARVCSAAFNFTLNRTLVFRFRAGGTGAAARYAVLCAAVAGLSAAGVTLLSTLLGVPEKLAKVLCDTCLFLLSYQAQARWVFPAHRQAPADGGVRPAQTPDRGQDGT